MQVKRQKQRDDTLDGEMRKVDKKLLNNIITAVTDVTQDKRVFKAVQAAKVVDFFSKLRKIWGDWDEYSRRIMALMSNYFENENEKRNM